ncbi:protein disks lost [Anopheles aquasalis]|uniref:protein disks lost n=1 Tax=Anopheles aquasalis TaxID=42839 RepID=UPI00215AB12D|nr:protein disks lost [Anopheles aquasalis]
MGEKLLNEMMVARDFHVDNLLEWFLQVFKKHESSHHHQSIEAFANYFIGFIHSQTEDSGKYAPPRCDTPRKTSSGNAFETSGAGRKLSIIGPDDPTTTGGTPTAPPTSEGDRLAEGSFVSGTTEPDTTGSSAHLRKRKLFDNHGPDKPDRKPVSSNTATTTTTDTVNQDDGRSSKPADSPVIGVSSTPNVGSNLSRCRSAGQPPVCATPPRNANRGVGGSTNNNNNSNSSMQLLSYTSTPIAREKLQGGTPNQRSNGGLSHHSQDASNGPQFRSIAEDGGGRRSKTSSPCLGDFLMTPSLKSHKNRRSSAMNSSGNHSGNEPSPGLQQSAGCGNNNSSLFQDNEFPQLSANSPATSTPVKGTGDSGREDSKMKFSNLNKSASYQQQHQQQTDLAGGSKKGQRRRIAPTTVSHTVSARHDFNSSSLKFDNHLVSLDSTDGTGGNDPRGMLRTFKAEIQNDIQAERARRHSGSGHAKQSQHLELAQWEEGQASAAPQSVTDRVDIEPFTGPLEPAELAPRELLVIDFDRVRRRASIDRLVAVYGLLMDLNLVPNLLNELAYLINLVSAERYIVPTVLTESGGGADSSECSVDSLPSILRNPHNCVYFATEVLHQQRQLLALLDCTTLRVVVENEQLSALQPALNGFLREVLAQKLKLETTATTVVGAGGPNGELWANSSIKNVFYQQENDTKDHFPSPKEFGAFNKQRDSFYTILRIWETEHLNSGWEFEAKLGAKVRSMMEILQHPINMAHLAKLFCAQLLISCNFDNSASELQMALPSIDLTKLSKLRARLVAPSLFSTQYLFPGNQVFFRDFVLASENHQIFIEQLKVVLIHELLQMNGSTYEIFNVAIPENQGRSEYVVSPESMSTMRVLAKFVGFIIARPFQYEGYRSILVDNRQIELRNTLLPPFDVKLVLLRSVVEKKLVITIPWITQYLSMLDAVTLRLRYYEELFRLLRQVYQGTATCELPSHRPMFIIPTSKFIVRACLDWLFDQPNVPEEYYSPQADCEIKVDGKSPTANIEQLALEQIGGFRKGNEIASDQASVASVPFVTRSKKKADTPIVFNPLLESVLSAACPFLADFRVAVMPSKVEKTLSRTGRYRHITTRYSGSVTKPTGADQDASFTFDPAADIQSTTGTNHQTSQKLPSHMDIQHRLTEAFLQSQSLSVRRMVEFIIERATSAVIKDFQMLYLLPEKKTVTDRIGVVEVTTLRETMARIRTVCDDALKNINDTWESHVPAMLNKRITDAFDGLLPVETIEAVRKTCKSIALDRCIQKTNEWRQSYMSDTDLFCKNIEGEASSMITAKQRPNAQKNQLHIQQSETLANANVVLNLSSDGPVMPAVLYNTLQALLHDAARSPHRITVDHLSEFLQQTQIFLDDPVLIMTGTMNRMLAYMLLQLFLLLIKSRCDLIVPDIVEAVVKIWKHKKLEPHCQPPVTEAEGSPTMRLSPTQDRSFVYPAQIEQFKRKRRQQESNYIFSHLISNRFVRMMEENPAPNVHYDTYAKFIIALVEAELITINLLNDQFVSIFNEEWPLATLDRISTVINRVLNDSTKAKSGRSQHNVDDSQSEMFMEMLSDLARGIEEF